MKINFPNTISADKWQRAYSIFMLLFFITIILDFSSLTMTAFMITNACSMTRGALCVAEGNPYTAYIFDNFGIPAMYLVLGVVWSILFGFIYLAKGRNLKLAVVVTALIVGLFLPAVIIDFLKNLDILLRVIFQS